ncbi:MAG: hypothetical protein WD013_02550 [Gemmatimonadota bacterium]
MNNDQNFEGTREEMERAIRRLNMLEYAILVAVVILALAGGGAAAFILSAGTNFPFRLTWGLISLLLLVIPGFFVFGKDYLKRRDPAGPGGD